MTDPAKPPSPLASIRAWITQAKNEVLVAFLATLATACFLFAPDTRWQALGHFVESVVSNPAGAIGAASAVGSIIGAFVIAYRSGRVPPGAGTLLVVVLLGASLTGCGASALVAQGRAATIASVAIGSVGQELHDARAEQLDACTDTGCTDAGERLWAPAVAAYESVRAALDTWIGALEVAQQAGAQDGDVLGALFVALTRLAREWSQLAEAIRALGVPELQPPDMPPIVTALLGAAS